MDHVIDKGVVIEMDSSETDRDRARGIVGIGLFTVDARVDVATDVDPALIDDAR